MSETDHKIPSPGGRRTGVVTLRLTTRESAVLKWLGENGPKSQHQICLDAVLPVIEAEYRRLSGDADFKLEPD